GVTAPNDGDQVIGAIPITITKSRYVPVRWNGEEQKGLNNNGPGARNIVTNQFTQAFRTLANEVEADVVAAAYKGASRAYGTAAATPFGTANDLTDAAGALQVLDANGAPLSDRQLVLGSSAMSNLRGKQSLLFKVNEAGTDQLLRDGVIGRLEGFDIHNSSGVKAVTKGTGASYTSDTAGYAIGATAITLITGTGTVLAGDVVTFAGDTNKYVVTTGVAAPGVITLAKPGLLVALPTSAVAMTVGGTFTPNLAFSKSAIILATRAPAVPLDMNGQPMDMAEDRVILTDAYSGISFEVSLYLQYRQIKYEIGLAWGEAVVKPEFVSILLG
ncbi:MAG: hypothetical protein JWP25_8933, partial [Bradyrhizobium sp.]|nr:hypothetical protein [Bradyrhizobium sp.]